MKLPKCPRHAHGYTFFVLQSAFCLHLSFSLLLIVADPLWLLKRPYGFFTFGMFLLLLAMVYTYTGKAYVRFQGWVYRAKEPKRYWGEVVTYYLLGAAFIGLFLYEVHTSSH